MPSTKKQCFPDPKIEAIYRWNLKFLEFAPKTCMRTPEGFERAQKNLLALKAERAPTSFDALIPEFYQCLENFDYMMSSLEDQKALLDTWEELRKALEDYANKLEIKFPSLQHELKLTFPKNEEEKL